MSSNASVSDAASVRKELDSELLLGRFDVLSHGL